MLGAERFDLVGWSMGALIGIEIAHRAPERLRRIVLIDHAGQMDGAAVARVERGLARLETVVEQPDDYVEAVRVSSGISPWNDFWDRFFRYELGPYGDGFKPTISKLACLEDLADIQRRDWRALWPEITMPALLVRCLIPISTRSTPPRAPRPSMRTTRRPRSLAAYTRRSRASASRAAVSWSRVPGSGTSSAPAPPEIAVGHWWGTHR